MRVATSGFGTSDLIAAVRDVRFLGVNRPSSDAYNG
jgi:hypothetical protein